MERELDNFEQLSQVGLHPQPPSLGQIIQDILSIS